MIDIQVFQRNPRDDEHHLKIWVGNKLIYTQPLCKDYMLIQVRNALMNEVAWLDTYLAEKGLSEARRPKDATKSADSREEDTSNEDN